MQFHVIRVPFLAHFLQFPAAVFHLLLKQLLEPTRRGIHPRWGKVFAIGHENDDEYEIGDWILVEHGRWSRGVTMEDENGIKTVVRVVEAESILGTSKEKPADVLSRRVDNDASYLTE